MKSGNGSDPHCRASDSGTSRLGAALAERLGIAHVDADSLLGIPTDPGLDERSLASHEAWLSSQAAPVLLLDSSAPVQDMVETVLARLPASDALPGR
jgi:hypothetical protein